MAVRNSHVRQSQAYVQKRIGGRLYHFYPYDWTCNKQKVRYVANKVAAGKLEMPRDCAEPYGVTIVYVRANGTLSPTEA